MTRKLLNFLLSIIVILIVVIFSIVYYFIEEHKAEVSVYNEIQNITTTQNQEKE